MRLPVRGLAARGGDNATLAETDREADHAPPPYQAVSDPDRDQTASLQLHPIPSKNALIVQVRPPTAPVPIPAKGAGTGATAMATLNRPPRHVPCDIVLVIDVSGSMGIRADVPGEEPSESPGLSVLDLTKHAALTILETLDDRDRLGIVTFSSKSQVVQRLVPMTPANKEAACRNIKYIKKQDATNLWHGLLDGIKLFRQANEEDAREGPGESSASSSDRVPALMVLTDGKPNFMCPPAGYVPKLRTMLPLPASIHTFGFGYNLESGLLKSIAEIGGGNYAFIPDAGMIGTVFVHAVANLQSTYATNAILELAYPRGVRLAETMGEYVGQQQPREITDGDGGWRLAMDLGNLQYGQSRDIYLELEIDSNPEGTVLSHSEKEQVLSAVVAAQLSYKQSASQAIDVTLAQRSILDASSSLPDAEIAYHESRAIICRYLASLFPLSVLEVHEAVGEDNLSDKRDELTRLIDGLPAHQYKGTDPANRSLMEDLDGPDPRGQIALAVRNSSYFKRWGVHYLPSLLNAHARQVCNSFKDQGPLQYGARSPLFIECRNRLDNAFDSLPTPEPSLPPRPQAFSTTYHHGGSGRAGGGSVGVASSTPVSAHALRAPFSMSRYHNPMGVCFAGSTPVELASSTPGLKRYMPIRRLRRGIAVRTPLGPRRVAAVLKTRVEGESLCRVPGGVLVTPWHPIAAAGTGKDNWVFPAQVAMGVVRYTGYVYSVLLQRDGDSRAHAIRVGGGGGGGTSSSASYLWGTTLGHGVTDDDNDGDVRGHEFFGDYSRVVGALLRLGVQKNGVIVGRGVLRDDETGLVTGFRSEHE